MKLFLIKDLPPHRTGGMEVYNKHLCDFLLGNYKDDVRILTEEKEMTDGRNVLPAGSRCLILTRWGLGMLSTLLYYTFSRKFKWKDIDYIYIPYTSISQESARPLLLWNKLFGLKYRVHIHGGRIAPWKNVKLMERFFDRAEKVAGVSHSIVEGYKERGVEKIEYLPPLIPIEKSHLGRKSLKDKYGVSRFDTIILYVGSIKPLKSCNTLLDAFVGIDADVLEKKRAGLVIAGGGIQLEELRLKYGADERILFLGNVDNSLVNECYAMADIYVIPSHFEGTPLSLIEAMFNGLACVGSDVRGINNILDGRNGLLFPMDDHKSLSRILGMLLEDGTELEKYKMSAKEYYDTHFVYSGYRMELEKFLGL